MALLDDLLNNPEKLKEFIKKGANNREKASFNHNLIQMYQYHKSPLLRNFIELSVIKPSLSRIERLSEMPFSEDLPEEYLTGDVIVGNYGENPKILIKLNLSEISGSIIIAGATGSGKTNVLLWILDQIQKQYEA